MADTSRLINSGGGNCLLANAIGQAKDELFELNKDNDDHLMKMALFMNANTLQSRYLAL